MDANERQVIDELFGRLRKAEGTRDPEAERFIAERVAAQPGAAYYMAQTIIVQEKALEAQARQGGAQKEGGGFLDSIFGRRDEPQRQERAPEPQRGGPWGGQPQRGGGGFLAGAAQTAVGVAGGVVVGSMLMDAFTTSPAEAAEAQGDSGDAGDSGADTGGGESFSDGGGDFGGDF